MPTDYSNDTQAEREQLAQKVFAFINNPNSDKEQLAETYLYLNELLELYPNQKPDWQKTEGLLMALICEPNAYCYRESFAEIVGDQILDLSNYPQNGCLDLAKTIHTKISDQSVDKKTRKTLNKWIEEMVTGGLETYPLAVIEAFICKPENAVYIPQFQEFLGENNETK